MSQNNKQGFTLIEMLLVIFILTTSLVTLVSLTTVSIARNRIAKEKIVGTRLAQDALEKLRNYRDQVGFDQLNITGERCLESFPPLLRDQDLNCQTNATKLYAVWANISLNNDTYTINVHVNMADYREIASLTGVISKWQ